jgi:D-glycero-D-manno-heptose 1,7-bisphosphate phosphatase
MAERNFCLAPPVRQGTGAESRSGGDGVAGRGGAAACRYHPSVAWAAFLDRDGVLTASPVVDGVPFSPATAEEMELLPGAVEAVGLLHGAGALVFVVTNQPDVARGRLDAAELERMHQVLRGRLGVDDVVACLHSDDDSCSCRKPRPGLFVELAARHGVDLASSWTVGDRWVDIAAGRAAGTTTVLVDRPSSWDATSAGRPPPDLAADHVAADVLDAAKTLLAARRQASWAAASPPE